LRVLFLLLEVLVARRSADMSGITDWWKKKEPQQPAGPRPPAHIDLYNVLRITPSASNEEIKAAFRSLALMFHPDRNQDDPVAAKKYTEISTAYAILGDEVQRAVYDRMRAQAAPPPPPPPIHRGIVPRPETREEPRQAKKEEKAPVKEFPSQTTLWEVMFSRPEEGKRPTGSPFEMFAQEAPRPPEIPSAQNPFSWAVPFQKKVPLTPGIDTPSPQEMFYVIENEWPLAEIWDIARQGRHSQEFYKTKAIAIDELAGAGASPAEFDSADMFGIPARQVDEFVHYRDRNAFFGEILHPLFDQVTKIMGQLKPADLPGQFLITWDTTGKVLMLIYAENAGRRPWE
jgi:curved DNA-binding protein CbpA